MNADKQAQGGGEVVAGTTLLFGNGAFIVNTGTFEGQHAAVFIDAAPEAGTVGAKAPPVPEGTAPLVRLVFPTREQAEAVCDALVSAPPSAPVGVEELHSLIYLWRQPEPDNGEDETEFDLGCAQTYRECADALEAVIAQQPSAVDGAK